MKLILRALAGLTASRQVNCFRTAEIRQLYTTIVEREGSEPLSHDQVTRVLKERSFLGITESEHTGGGPSEGSYIEHRLMRYPDILLVDTFNFLFSFASTPTESSMSVGPSVLEIGAVVGLRYAFLRSYQRDSSQSGEKQTGADDSSQSSTTGCFTREFIRRKEF